MPATKRQRLAADAARLTAAQLGALGRALLEARLRRRLTQDAAAALAGIGRSTAGRMERGHGGHQSLDSWQRYALAVGRPLRIGLERDALEGPADAGHLPIQELLLRLGRRHRYEAIFEAGSNPADPARSIDVQWRDESRRLLFVLEAWNTIGDIGAGARSFARNLAEAEAHGIAIGHGRPYLVHGCWVLRATARCRALVARYPEVFAARFPGSSERWARAITAGDESPADPGLVWCDLAATRVFAWRRRPDRLDKEAA